jgi:hypothetical protein
MKAQNFRRNSGIILAASLLLFAVVFGACDSLQSSINEETPPVLKIIIKPDFKNIRGISIGIFNFNNCDRSDILGHAFAQYSRRHLLEHKFMQVVGLSGIMPENVQDAIEVGRSEGYDLILTGYVSEYYYGGLSSDSRVSVSIRIIDVRTEAILGYINGRIEGRYEERFDYIVYKKESREAPLPSLLGAKVIEKILNEITGNSEIPEK